MKSIISFMNSRSAVALFLGFVLAMATGMWLMSQEQSDADVASVDAALPTVKVASALQLASEETVSLIGNVRAFTEAAVTSEVSGRVTGVRVGLGDFVSAGQIMVTLENASQRAAVLQAEGVYDAAVAASAQNDISVTEAATGIDSAKNNVRASVSNAYTSVHTTVVANIDQFFSDPNGTTPGLRISGQGYTGRLNELRIQYQELLPTWKTEIDTLSNNDSDLRTAVQNAKQNVALTTEFVDTFLVVFTSQDSQRKYSESQLANFSSTFGSLRNSLVQHNASLDSALSTLTTANEARTRAELSATGSDTSAADAQIKQALGSLRAAQANLAKTILRSPIAGTVNEISVKTGDFVGGQQQVAEVANNNALEIVAFASDAELFALTEGESVEIEGQYQGTITSIAPAVDGATGKTEVRIAADNPAIKNGDTVRIGKIVTTKDAAQQPIQVPLTALKFELEDGFMFVVVDEKLTKRPVELGTIFGNSVEIVSGIDRETQFVLDVRGRNEGEAVQVTS